MEPGPGRPPTDPVPKETLQLKIRALKTDPCHRDPSAQRPQGCEKFITQLGNTTATAREAAGTYPRLKVPVEHMQQSIDAYRAADCASAQPRDERACVQTLTELATALDEAEAALAGG